MKNKPDTTATETESQDAPREVPNTPPAHQLRVVEEKKDLDEKLNKLTEFKGTKTFDELPAEERVLLMKQSHVMTAYSLVLGQRIKLFNL